MKRDKRVLGVNWDHPSGAAALIGDDIVAAVYAWVAVRLALVLVN